MAPKGADPVCANGNLALCPGDPTTPATVVTSGGSLTGETVDWSNQQYQNALNQYGSVISNVATTGNYNWFTTSLGGKPSMGSAAGEDICMCIIDGYSSSWVAVVAGALAAGAVGTSVGNPIAQLIDQILHNAASGDADDEDAPDPAGWIGDPDVRAKVPEAWGPGSSNKKGVGTRWVDPENKKGNSIRIDKGDPNNPQKSQQEDHVVISHNGVQVGRDGKPLPGRLKDNYEQGHIPVDEWKTWETWWSPN